MYYKKAKIYSDGSHYIAILDGAYPKRKGQTTTGKRSTPSPERQRFDEAYKDALSMPKRERKSTILEALEEGFGDRDNLYEFVNENMARVKTNEIKRKVRLMRKLRLQEWTHFCTFTYDDKLHTEETFRKKLSNTLKHFVYRNGWKYVGVWERSPEKERLHFHGIFYIPQMVGTIETVEDYSTISHCKQTTYQNSHFLKRFGRNDFRPIDGDADVFEAAKYITKYLEKTGEKLVYAGKLPTYFQSDLIEEDIVCNYGDNERKKILYDKFTCIDEGELVGKVSKETIAKLPKCN